MITFSNLLVGQEQESSVKYEGNTMLFVYNEQYSDFNYIFGNNNGLQIELRGFYQRNAISERFRVPLILKKYLTEKSYILGGVQSEWEFIRGGAAPPRLDVLLGAGHEFNESFSVEGILQLPVANSKYVNPLGAERSGTGFLNLGSKIKF